MAPTTVTLPTSVSGMIVGICLGSSPAKRALSCWLAASGVVPATTNVCICRSTPPESGVSSREMSSSTVLMRDAVPTAMMELVRGSEAICNPATCCSCSVRFLPSASTMTVVTRSPTSPRRAASTASACALRSGKILKAESTGRTASIACTMSRMRRTCAADSTTTTMFCAGTASTPP